MPTLLDRLLALPSVRYAAHNSDGVVTARERPGLTNASSSESDKYEELLVNPTVLRILTLRGEIDCGGLRYVVIRYGSFFQFVMPVSGGHVSAAIEKGANVGEIVEQIIEVIGSA